MNNIIISALTLSDQDAVFDLLQNEKVMNFLGPRRPLNNQEAQDWFKNELTLTTRFAFREAHTLELIGFCGIKKIKNKHDFGYFLREKFWGNGYATQMCQLAIEQLKTQFDFKQVQVFIADENLASLKLAKKLNWTAIKKSNNEFETGWIFQIKL